jgi:hypothetical protein
MGGEYSTHRNAYKILVEKSEAKRLFGRPRHRWKEIIKMDRSEIGWEGAEWIHVAQDRDECRAVVNTVMNLRVP